MRTTELVLCALVVAASVSEAELWGQGTARAPAVSDPAATAPIGVDAAARMQLTGSYAELPLSFEANQGQNDPQVKFVSRGSGYNLFLTATDAVLCLRNPAASVWPDKNRAGTGTPTNDEDQGSSLAVLRMKLVGADPHPRVAGADPLPGKVNYFVGKDVARWRTGIPTYARVKYEGIYPGVDVIYYGNQRQLEYDFLVAPGGDPGAIRLGFEGADRLELEAGGDLLVHVPGGQVRLHKPLVYQQDRGSVKEVAGKFVVYADNEVGFQVPDYDTTRTLVIDPIVLYATYLGGTTYEMGWGIAVDSAGNAYVTGETSSANYPTAGTGPAQTTYAGGNRDAFVTKLNAAGNGLVYSTYLGGNDFDCGEDIVVDASGNAYVTGETESANFPTTAGAFMISNNPTYSDSYGKWDTDAFVAKLNSSGGLAYSTYFGGSYNDFGVGIAADGSGSAYITGRTLSTDLPVAPSGAGGAFQSTLKGQSDTFVAKFNSSGSGLVYSTYLGGNDWDDGEDIAVDGSGSAYVTGDTMSSNFPTTSGAYQTTTGGGNCPDSAGYSHPCPDAFVTKLNPTGTGLVYSTYLGGNQGDWGRGIAVLPGAAGPTDAYVTGETFSTNFPVLRQVR